jgi:hypothetical protein
MKVRLFWLGMAQVMCAAALAQFQVAGDIYEAEFRSPPDGSCVRFSVNVKFHVDGPLPLDVELTDDLGNKVFDTTYYSQPPDEITVAYSPTAYGVPDGLHTLTLVASGRGGSAQDTLDLHVDATPPTAQITYPVEGGCLSGIVSVAGSVTDNYSGPGTWAIQVDGVQVGAGIGSDVLADWDTTGLVDGTSHVILLKALDQCGNPGQSTPVTVIVDNTAPNLINIFPPSGSTVTGIVTVTATVEEGQTVDWWVLVDGSMAGLVPESGSGTQILTSWDTTQYADGLHTLEMRISDGCGNTRSFFLSITVENNTGGETECKPLKNLIAGPHIPDPFDGMRRAFRPQTINIDLFTVRDVLVANDVDITDDTLVQCVRVYKMTPFYKCTALAYGPGSGLNTNFNSGWVYATSDDSDRSVVEIAFAAYGGVLGNRCLLFSPPGTLYVMEITYVTRLPNGRLTPPETVCLCWVVVIENRQDIRDNVDYFATVAAGATQKPKIAGDVAAALNAALDIPDPLEALFAFETVVAVAATDFHTLRDPPQVLHLFGYLVDSDEEPIGCLLIEQANALLWK